MRKARLLCSAISFKSKRLATLRTGPEAVNDERSNERLSEEFVTSTERKIMAALVAQKYYLDRSSKSAIADEMGLSRFQVARLLELAHAEELVTITVESPPGIDADLSEALRHCYGLTRAVVVHAATDVRARRLQLGQMAATLLSEILTEDDCLGVAWGRHLAGIPSGLRKLAPCPVVQLTGVAGSVSDNPIELIRQICQASGGHAYPIYAPLVVVDAATTRGLRRQEGVARAFALHTTVTHAIVTVGSWNPSESLLQDELRDHERQRLQGRGVVADICGTLLTHEGDTVHGLEEHSIAISTDALVRVPETIAVAGGRSKVTAIRAGILSGLLDSLVTDTTAARDLVALS